MKTYEVWFEEDGESEAKKIQAATPQKAAEKLLENAYKSNPKREIGKRARGLTWFVCVKRGHGAVRCFWVRQHEVVTFQALDPSEC